MNPIVQNYQMTPAQRRELKDALDPKHDTKCWLDLLNPNKTMNLERLHPGPSVALVLNSQAEINSIVKALCQASDRDSHTRDAFHLLWPHRTGAQTPPAEPEPKPAPAADAPTLRDQFAMAALQSPWVTRYDNASTVAEAAYLIADAMLAARIAATPEPETEPIHLPTPWHLERQEPDGTWKYIIGFSNHERAVRNFHSKNAEGKFSHRLIYAPSV